MMITLIKNDPQGCLSLLACMALLYFAFFHKTKSTTPRRIYREHKTVRTENEFLSMLADIHSPFCKTQYSVDVDARGWNHEDWMNVKWMSENPQENVTVVRMIM